MTEFQPIRFGKYTLLERIGVGPMAEFFRASSPDGEGDGDTVFVKRLLPHLKKNQHLVNTLSDAARLSGHFQHKNIASVCDYGTIDGTFYLVTEFLAGQSLQDLLVSCEKNGHPLGLENALNITSQICEGLSYAHGFEDPDGVVTHVVHCNLSPQAIFITSDGEAKLTDFGIHSENGQDRTAQLDMVKWKLSYMSPEQVGGDTIDKRTDIFSMGLLLYEMITGMKVFEGETMEVFSMVRQAHFELPKDFNRKVPPKVSDIIHRCLSKSPVDRYPSAGAMLEDLRGAMEKASIKVSPEFLCQRLRPFHNNTSGKPSTHPSAKRPEEKKEIQTQPASSANPKQMSGDMPTDTARKKAAATHANIPKSGTEIQPARKNRATRTVSLLKKSAAAVKKKAYQPKTSTEKQKSTAPRTSSNKTSPKKRLWYVAIPATVVVLLAVSLLIMDIPKHTASSESTQTPTIQSAYRCLEGKDFKKAVSYFEQAMATNPDTRDDISQAYAKSLDGLAASLLKERPQEAKGLLLTARKFDPQSVQIAIRLGLLYLNQKEYGKAITAYEEAVQLDPQLADAFFNLGYVYAITNDFLKAQEMYAEAVKLSPPFLDEALFNLAVVQSQVGKRNESIKNLKRAIKINPENKQAQHYLQTLTS